LAVHLASKSGFKSDQPLSFRPERPNRYPVTAAAPVSRIKTERAAPATESGGTCSCPQNFHSRQHEPIDQPMRVDCRFHVS
jgi:hypothetical protein